MRRLVGELDHVLEPLARARHFMRRQRVHAGLIAEAPQCIVRRHRQAPEFRVEIDIEFDAQPLEGAAKRGVIVRVERAREIGD